MDTYLDDEELEPIVAAKMFRRREYFNGYNMYEFNREPWMHITDDRVLHNQARREKYQRLEVLFNERVTTHESIRRLTGYHPSSFHALCRNPLVMASATESIAEYRTFTPFASPEPPMSIPILLMIALEYMDTGGNFKQMRSNWEIPRISKLVEWGKKAIIAQNNIQLPTTAAEWITSALGLERMHGLPNVVAALDITPIYSLFDVQENYCPELKRYCLKVATLVDSSGKFLAYKVFPAGQLEPDMLEQWSFYQRLKATEADIRLPGAPVHNGHRVAELLGGFPYRMKLGPGTNSWSQNIAGGIIVDGRYGDHMCSLFIAPSQFTMTVFDQRLYRTRMFIERIYGILTQYSHIKERLMPMEANCHDMHTSVAAMLSMMNLRISLLLNPEHPCLR